MRFTPCCDRLADEETLPRSQMLESRWLAKCLLNYIARHRERVDALFELLSIFTSQTRVSLWFLKTYLKDRVAADYSYEERRKVQPVPSPHTDHFRVFLLPRYEALYPSWSRSLSHLIA